MIKGLKNSAEFRNIFWMTADRLWRMAISLVIGVWMVRYLGPDSFGQINYVLAFISIATVVTGFGMESFLIRELVSSPGRKNELVYSAFALRLAASALVFLILLLYFYLSGEPRIVFLLFFLLVPQLFTNPFAVVDIAFQAELKSKIPIICRNTFFVFGAILKAVAIITHQDIYIFALLTILDMVLADIFLFFYYRKRQLDASPKKIALAGLKELSFKALPFLLSGVAIVIYMKVDQILLGKLASPAQVGYFTATTKIAEVFYFIPLVITGSLFGLLVNARKESLHKYLSYSKKVFFYLIVFSGIISTAVFLFADPIISLLFGTKFSASAGVLQVYIWSVVLVFAGVAFNQLLIIEEMQNIILYKTLIGVVTNIVLNFQLIPQYGAAGAALATVITQFISSIAANFFFDGSRRLFLSYFINPVSLKFGKSRLL